jgi:hypothetical protein
MPVNAPPILCKHPMLKTIETLASNDGALMSMIQGIVLGGAPADRLQAIEADGLLYHYDEGEKALAHRALLTKWGDEKTLRHISDTLGQALQLVRASEPKKALRAWWAVGAAKKGIRCVVTEDDDTVYFVMLTEPLDDVKVADKAAFDQDFIGELKAQAKALEAWTDPL